MRDVDAGFQPSYGDSVAALDALREARAEIDALRARAVAAERERDEASAEVERLRSEWKRETYDVTTELAVALLDDPCMFAMDTSDTAALTAAEQIMKLRKVRDAADRVVDAHDKQHTRLSGYGVLDAAVSALRSALTAARGEEKE
jgi:hypothetical protein